MERKLKGSRQQLNMAVKVHSLQEDFETKLGEVSTRCRRNSVLLNQSSTDQTEQEANQTYWNKWQRQLKWAIKSLIQMESILWARDSRTFLWSTRTSWAPLKETSTVWKLVKLALTPNDKIIPLGHVHSAIAYVGTYREICNGGADNCCTETVVKLITALLDETNSPIRLSGSAGQLAQITAQIDTDWSTLERSRPVALEQTVPRGNPNCRANLSVKA